jgi:DNA repair protein RecN (Recombination protein N)
MPRDDLGPHGGDDIEFLLAGHADAPLRPVARAASGGELSRVMLALEVALVGADVVPTLVFDEVDAGVGGDAARALAGRLAVVSATSQLLVVTHLAQVAAAADHHLALRSAGDRIDSVEPLHGDARVREVARMLSGTADSSVSLDHARELLASAARPSLPSGRDC